MLTKWKSSSLCHLYFFVLNSQLVRKKNSLCRHWFYFFIVWCVDPNLMFGCEKNLINLFGLKKTFKRSSILDWSQRQTKSRIMTFSSNLWHRQRHQQQHYRQTHDVGLHVSFWRPWTVSLGILFEWIRRQFNKNQ